MDLCVTSKLHMTIPCQPSPSFAEAVELAKNAGFTQMDYGFSAQRLLEDQWKEDALDDFETAQRSGIRFRYAHLPYDYPKTADGWPGFRKATMRAIELAAMLRVDCATVHPNTVLTTKAIPDVRQRTIDFLRPYVDHAKKNGLVLALENQRGPGKGADPAIWRYCTNANDVLDVAEELDIGVCWDTGHANICKQDQFASILKVAPRLKELHMNDNFADGDIHIAPFIGNVDWQGVVRALRAIGYCGAVNLEVTTNGLPPDLRQPYAVYMGKAARRLSNMIEAKA